MTGSRATGQAQICVEQLDGGRLLVNAAFADLLAHNGVSTAADLWALRGEGVKNVLAERGTERIRLQPTTGDEPIEAYIKHYLPIPFRQTLKAVLSLKPFGFDGHHEWEALLAFHRHGLPTMVPMAVGLHGANTCNLTLGLQNCTRVSELFPTFGERERERKRRLIRKVAQLAGRMHALGFAHQDFYLVHLFVDQDQDDALYLIDLQRLIMRASIGRRWRVKDLAQLLFSAWDHVTATDRLRFWKTYTQFAGPGLYRDRRLIRSVIAKARHIRARDERKSRERAEG